MNAAKGFLGLLRGALFFSLVLFGYDGRSFGGVWELSLRFEVWGFGGQKKLASSTAEHGLEERGGARGAFEFSLPRCGARVVWSAGRVSTKGVGPW